MSVFIFRSNCKWFWAEPMLCFLVWFGLNAHAQPVQSHPEGSTQFYLLSAMTTPTSPDTYPATLYVTQPGGPPTLVRTVVAANVGANSVLDDMGDEIALFSPNTIPNTMHIIHKSDPTLGDDATSFNDAGAPVVGSALVTGASADGERFALVPLATLEPSFSVNLELLRLNAKWSEKHVLAGFPDDYKGIRYQGWPGGPAPVVGVLAYLRDGRVSMGQPSTVPLDPVPDTFAANFAEKTLLVVGASEKYLVLLVQESSNQLDRKTARNVFIHDRIANTWRTLTHPGSYSESKLLGDWLVTEELRPVANYLPEDLETYTRGQSEDTRLSYASFNHRYAYGTGKLTLDNLRDHRSIVFDTGREDTEGLFIAGHEIIYRINDEIYSGHLGTKTISSSVLIAKSPDMENVHWAFPKTIR